MTYAEFQQAFDQFESRVGEIQELCEKHAPTVYPKLTRYCVDWHDEDVVALEWEEYWSYGGYERHSASIPGEWFDMSNDKLVPILKKQESAECAKRDKKKTREAERSLETARKALERAQSNVNKINGEDQ